LFLGIAADIIEPGGPDQLIRFGGDGFGGLHLDGRGRPEEKSVDAFVRQV
jgi:hypothetical protein